MKKKRTYTYQKKKNKKGSGLTIFLSITALLMTGLVLWIAVNDWDVKRSYERGLEVVGVSKQPEVEKEPADTTLLPDSDEGESSPETSVDEDADDGLVPVGGETELPEEPTEPAEPQKVEPSPSPGKVETKPAVPEKVDAGGYIEGQKLPKEPTFIKNVLVANKKYPLPSTFAPGESKEARVAFDKMAAEAKLDGYNLNAFSTYRAYDYQVGLYDRYAARDGKKAADTYSARPGYSEHQTGLAFDIGEVNFEQHWASSSFGETKAGQWVNDNAHRYGFILRYPKGKEHITGYMHESWHFRYVGEKIAAEIFKNKGTLEEYLGIE